MIRRLAQWVRHTVSGSYARSEAVPFVIVFVARTGSNYLAAKLDSHPDVICHHEVFNPEGVHRSLTYKGTDVSFGTVAERDRDPWAFMQRIFSFTDGASAVGFKLSPRENDWALLSLLLTRLVRKIVLSRRNWLQVYTSGLIASRTEVWSQPTSGASPTQRGVERVRVDPAEFQRYARKRELFYRVLRAGLRLTGQRFFTLDYTEIDDDATIARLLWFLEVPGEAPLSARTAKQNPSRLRDRIENYDEVEAALRRTRYASMLD